MAIGVIPVIDGMLYNTQGVTINCTGPHRTHTGLQ